jgi:uncharacterized protein YlxW (UPF0749 family)
MSNAASLLRELTSNDVALKAKLVEGKTDSAAPPAKRAKGEDFSSEIKRLEEENARLVRENEALKNSLKAFQPSAEDVTKRATALKSSLYSKCCKAMSVWKNSCKGNGARFTVEVGCTPAVLEALLGEKIYSAAVKGAKVGI